MLSNYLKITAKKFFNYRKGRSTIYAWINLGGLAVGFTAFLMIAHAIFYELSYDRYYPNHRNIYRLTLERNERGEVTMQSAKTYAGIGKILMNEIPEVEHFVRILSEECMFSYEPDEIIINRQQTFWADGNIIEFFGLNMISAGQLGLLHTPNQAIISRTAAERLFGYDWIQFDEPIGKTLLLNGGVPFIIQGVFEDLPDNIHMKVDFIVSYSTLMALLGDFMNTEMPPQSNFVYNYLAIREGSDVRNLESVINKTIRHHTSDLDDQVKYGFFMQPITSIHLYSRFSDELNPNGNHFFVMGLSIAAFLIIIMAWINFINLTIARASSRSKEVGIRKAIGAGKGQLATQFIIETIFSGFVSMLIALIISFMIGNHFNRITGISILLFSTQSWLVWMVFLATFLVGTILASIYPAMILSSFNPIKALRGKKFTIHGYTSLRQGLILFQFCVAMLLLAVTGAVYYQVESMRHESLGVNMDQVLVIHSPRSMIGNTNRTLYFKQFRDFLEPDPDIVTVASGGCLPGEKFLYHTEDVHAEGNEVQIKWSFDVASVDEHYLSTLGMKLLAGRPFEERPDEENKVILNETGIEALGFKNPFEAIGRYVRINQTSPQQIIGILEDAHFEGLHTNIKPLLLKYGHDYEFGFFPIKIKSSDLGKTIDKIENQWKTTYPRDPFEYFFLDQFFDRQYQNDLAFGYLFGSFSLLAILISGIGLFGLISYATNQKSKEIGIRKVMGANVFSIIKLLTWNMLKMILLAALISMPLSYWLIRQWLDSFAYRFDPSIWMYFLPLILLLFTSMVAVGSQTLKSALSNPVDAIAEEGR